MAHESVHPTPPAAPDDEAAEAEQAVMQAVADSFRAFAVRFRRDIDRPMTDREWRLAEVAHCFGFTDGAESALRLEAAMEKHRACKEPTP